MEEYRTDVREKSLVLVRTMISMFKFIGRFFLSICLLIWECFSWLAYKRLNIPRISLGIELAIFAVPCILMSLYYLSRARMAEDREGKELYKVTQAYKDSLIKAEIIGWARGRREVLDSIRLKKEDNIYKKTVEKNSGPKISSIDDNAAQVLIKEPTAKSTVNNEGEEN